LTFKSSAIYQNFGGYPKRRLSKELLQNSDIKDYIPNLSDIGERI
jgi:hypothetical protein